MKKHFSFLFIFCLLNGFSQQSILGKWKGTLSVQGFKIEMILNVSNENNRLVVKMDVPMQGAYDIAADTASFEDNRLRVDFKRPEAVYKGKLEEDSLYITGYWYQGGQQLELDLVPADSLTGKINRPQEPLKPYPYYEEDVIFQNQKAGINLAGTLTLPSKEGMYPVVIMITGSGANNRDEAILGHKPFLVIADYLTRQGIGVLRVDDRGVGKSGGDISKATSADFASDVMAAIDYLESRKEVNKSKVGLIGHSEGGMIAPMVASQRKDVAFIVLLAGPGLKGSDLMIMQNAALAKASGFDEQYVKDISEMNRKCYSVVCSEITDSLKEIELKKIMGDLGMEAAQLNQVIDNMLSPWMNYFLKFDPQPYLKKTKCPVLAINGEKDLQVAAKENLAAIEKALKLGGNKNYTAKALPGLNHLFQHTESGFPSEYGTIEETFAPEALKIIGDWVKEVTKK
jgi:uncharacterized protein